MISAEMLSTAIYCKIQGTCAVVFALLGFKIHGICYSDYLTTRDYADFFKLFQAFKVQNRIEYSTITSFSEKKALAKGNLRKFTEDLLLGSLWPVPFPWKECQLR